MLLHAAFAIEITGRYELVSTLLVGVTSGFVSLGLVHRFITRQYPDIFVPVVYLYGVGWLELLRLRSDLALKQSLWIFVATLASVAVYRVLRPIGKLERFRVATLAGGLLLLFSALLVGTEVNGAKLWLRIGNVSFQPIEVVKIQGPRFR